MALNWSEEKLNERIESEKARVSKLERKWTWYIEQRLKNTVETPKQADSSLKSSLAASAQSIGLYYSLLENGVEARTWFRLSAEKRFESMSQTYFHDTESRLMIITAILSRDKKLAQSIASKMLGSGVVAALSSDFIKKQCELYASIILEKGVIKKYLADMEKIEGLQCKKISGLPPGAVKCCRGIIERNKNILVGGLSTMLPFTKRYAQTKGSIPVAMEESMMLILAQNVGIDVGPQNFLKYREILPECIFKLE